MYVTDTHGLIWFLTDDRKLGKKAEKIFLSADRGDATVVIPSIVLLEILHICEKQNAKLKFKQIWMLLKFARI
jgi:predicted nucleic acid-binding protein